YALISLSGHLLARLFRREWKYADNVALFFACVVGIVQYCGLTVGHRILDVNRVTLASPLLPQRFDGFRVVQLSDLHVGTYFSDTTFVSAVVDSVNRLCPDLIVFTGDMINVTPEELRPEFAEILSRLKAPCGVYSVLGNHDYCIYGGIRSEQEVRQATAEVVRLEKSMGWDVLRDEHRLLVRGGDTLVLAGTDNVAKPRPLREGEYVPPAGSLKKALRGVPTSLPVLLLTHDPWHWRREVTADPRVLFTLSGHTHALHLRIGDFSPAAWIMPEWGGKYVSRNGVLYVSTGLGGSVPYRLGAWPAIELITLRKGSAAE
ncbi:MAG: metallophosphoesterase, partial [Alloprevotella sp.]